MNGQCRAPPNGLGTEYMEMESKKTSLVYLLVIFSILVSFFVLSVGIFDDLHGTEIWLSSTPAANSFHRV